MNSIQLTTGQRKGAMVAAALGTGYGLLSLRLLPTGVMRVWFALTMLSTVFTASVLCYIIDPLRYLGVPRRVTQFLCTAAMSVGFKACCFLNPQVKRRVTFDANDEGKPKSFADMPNGSAIVLNHTSFWDTFEIIAVMPVSKLVFTRTLMKSSLRKIPIFGGCFDRVGHFPVYFKSDEDGIFHVDKERQAKVQVRVDEHISRSGNLVIFPEGAVNKNPKVLQAFRYGTFATIFQHRMPVYYLLMVGNERTWPRDGACGGAPADIVVHVGAYPIDFDAKDSKQVASEMRDFMQGVYDKGLAELEAASGSKKASARPAAAEEPRLATA